MTIATRQTLASLLVEWAPTIVLALAACWSAWKLSASFAAAAGAATAALVVGWSAMKGFGENRAGRPAGFDPVPLVEFSGDSGELLLDDPLVEVPADARVVRLFAREQATPGELLAKIEDFLGEERSVHGRGREGMPPPPDANVALHAALANIKASLR